VTQVIRYPEQFSFVGTEEQASVIEALVERLGTDKAKIMRYALNRLFDLTPAGRLKGAEEVDDVVQRLEDKINKQFSGAPLP
jgi:hypothetical protein